MSFVSKSYGENVDEIFRVDNQWANRSLFEYLCLGKGPHDWTNIEPPLRTAIAFGLLSVKIGHANTSREILWVDHIPQLRCDASRARILGPLTQSYQILHLKERNTFTRLITPRAQRGGALVVQIWGRLCTPKPQHRATKFSMKPSCELIFTGP